MTPKEKAKILVDKMMYEIMYNCQPTLSEMVAKKCALIAVDEIIEMYNELNVNGFLKSNSIRFILDEIKQEIQQNYTPSLSDQEINDLNQDDYENFGGYKLI